MTGEDRLIHAEWCKLSVQAIEFRIRKRALDSNNARRAFGVTVRCFVLSKIGMMNEKRGHAMRLTLRLHRYDAGDTASD